MPPRSPRNQPNSRYLYPQRKENCYKIIVQIGYNKIEIKVAFPKGASLLFL